MAVVLLMGAVILLFMTLGYDIDRKTGAIIQKGLVFVDAHPQAATIYLNGENKGQTGARITPPAGHYTLELKRPGYRTWKSQFDLYGGTIERFVYPFLFPEKLNTTQKQTYASPPSLATISPNQQWLVLGRSDSLNSFDVVDVTNPAAQITNITLPAGVLTATKARQHVELAEWSTDNRHVLLRHVMGSTGEYIMLDRQSPSSSININKTFNLNPTKVTLRDKKPDQLYFYSSTGGVLETANLRSRSVLPLLTHVLTYRTHGDDMLLFVSDAAAQTGKVKVKIRDGDKEYTLKELPARRTYLLDLAQYDGRWYMAAGTSDEGKVSIYRNPTTTLSKTPTRTIQPISTLRLDRLGYLSVSANARFIAAQSGSQFAVYDAERDTQYRYDTKLKLTPNQKAAWMDGHRLSLVSQNTSVVFDFDGINLQKLSPASPLFPLFFSKDYQALYTIAPLSGKVGGTALTRTELIVK